MPTISFKPGNFVTDYLSYSNDIGTFRDAANIDEESFVVYLCQLDDKHMPNKLFVGFTSRGSILFLHSEYYDDINLLMDYEACEEVNKNET